MDTQPRHRRLQMLVVVVAADVIVAGVTRFANLLEVVQGGGDWVDEVSAAGAVFLPPLLLAVWWGYRHVVETSAWARAEHDELQALAASSHDWLWHCDPELVLTASSPAVAEILGYRADDLVGRPMLELLHPDDRATARAVIYRGGTHGTGWRDIELRWRHADGRDIRLQGSGAPVLDAAGAVVGYRGARRPAPTDRLRGEDLAAARRRVQQVLDEGLLRVALQPIIDLPGDRWAAAEALARFTDGRGPDAWFAEAQAAGLGVELELLALRSAVDVLPVLPPDITLNINASPSLILDPRLRDALGGLGPHLSRLTLEITEHAEVTAYDEIHEVLAALREHGLRLAVDDTGAGYASFAHVIRLRPDVVKVDRSLVTGIDTDPARRAFVTAVVLLALELGASVTGEGVETARELSALCDLGVDHAQGYHLAKPTVSTASWRTWRTRSWTATSSTSGSAKVTRG